MADSSFDDTWFYKILSSIERDGLMSDLVEMESSPSLDSNGSYGSPVEHAFATAMRVLIRIRYPELKYAPRFGLESTVCDAEATSCGEWALIYPQVKFGAYRVDFSCFYLVGSKSVKRVVIECDGHEFHERTKDQASRDKARERALVSAGCRIMRFTGSDVFSDPIRCADEVLQYIHSQAQTYDELHFHH